MTKKPVLLGIGNALVDIMIRLESDDSLKHFELPKGSMTLVDADFAQKVYNETEGLPKEITSGGSVANSMRGLASLGMKCGYIGKTNQDEFGAIFKKEMEDAGVSPIILNGENPTGKATALISPDSERTFATYLGAAIELSADDLNKEMFDGYNYFHIEGYLVQNHELIERSAQLAKEAGLKVSIDLASYNVVEDNKEFLRGLVKNYVDIVFANEEEAKAISDLEPEEALHWLSEFTEIAVVKIGKEGSLIKKDGEVTKVGGSGKVSVDTTGAGDLYAAGFYYGLLNGLSMDKCGAVATILAGRVIEVIGAVIPEKEWDCIKSEIAAL
ncbi:adenosine kinase [Puteibacter caeruleilacunae]|nr:adenosine kinase [Puteibacter caeruleilacunae]